MATSVSNPREIQDRDKKAKAATGAQHPEREGDAVRVRTEEGWANSSKGGKNPDTDAGGQKAQRNK